MKKDNEKQETYLISEKGPEGSLTGRTIVYKPGEWSERYDLLKAAAADDPEHKRNFIDIELKDLKRDHAIWSQEKKGYFDARGKKYSYSQMMKQNQYVKAKANTITDDVNLVNKFIQTKGHDWVSKWEKDYEKEYGEPYAPQDEDLVAEKELKKQKAIEELKELNEKKIELSEFKEEVITKLPEKTIKEIVNERAEKRRINEIEQYEKDFGKGGIVELMKPL
jgi:hypothetical protein